MTPPSLWLGGFKPEVQGLEDAHPAALKVEQ